MKFGCVATIIYLTRIYIYKCNLVKKSVEMLANLSSENM